MITRIFPALILLFSSFYGFAQDQDLLKAHTIPLELKANANAVVRYDNTNIEISAYNRMTYSNKRAVTILNSSGDNKHGAVIHYDDNIYIKKLEARIYDASGEEIKKIRKSDFQDVSTVSGGSLYEDNRVKYLDYTAINYPYTVVFETEVDYKSTAFINGWRPLEGYYISTQNANYKITNTSGVELKIKTGNFGAYGIEKIEENHFVVKNQTAIKPEQYSPAFNKYAPYLKATLTEFDMEGVKGINNNWQDFGKWVNDKLIQGTQELPLEVKEEVKALVANAKTDLDKAKIVYEYMQNKTRYISVQVGIGGWKPMNAEDVDRLGYGDCKGLTNYTKAMLDHLGVESYYTLIYGGRRITDFDKEFSKVEGNHAILAVPDGEDYVWLECTSQTNPFGYNAGFTDDRDALIITPEGGKIVHTKVYPTDSNLQTTNAKVTIGVDGQIFGDVTVESFGYQYNYHQDIERKSAKDRKLYYKDYWDYINNLTINNISLENDKDNIVFREKVTISATNYASKSGERLLLQPNMFNKVSDIPSRYTDRKQDFEIQRGFVDKDEFIIKIDSKFQIEALPEPVSIDNKYGTYNSKVEKISEDELKYTRTYKLNKGYYKKEEYNDFRKFKRNVVKYDKVKMVLISKT